MATSRRLHVNRSFSSATATEEFLSRFHFSKIPRPHLEFEIDGETVYDSILPHWMKVNIVVDFLKKLPTPPYVHVNFGKYSVPPSGYLREHIHYFTCSATGRNSYTLADHDVLILPFTCFTNWHYTLPADLRAAVLKDPEALEQTLVHLFKLENPTEADGSNEVYTAFDTSEMSQTHYVYEPQETSWNKELIRIVNESHQGTIQSLIGPYVDVGVGDESQDRQLLAAYDRISNLLFAATHNSV
jgi:hypothetical protein